MALGQLAIWVMHVPLLCVAVIVSQSKSEAQEQTIPDLRNRVSIPPQSSQSIGTRWNTVETRSQKTAERDPVAVLRIKEVDLVEAQTLDYL